MAINPSTTYAGRITVADANYPYGSSKNESTPGAGDGTPYELARANDVFGMQQALLKAAGIVPSGNPDTILVAEYIQSLVEIASGRAYNYDESGIADVYVLDVKADQQKPRSYFDGLVVEFTPGNTSTGASTVDVAGLGAKDIAGTGAAGVLVAGSIVRLRYNAVSGDFDIVLNLGASGSTTGHVLQVLQSVKTDTQSASGSWWDVTGLSVAITPISTSSKILVIYDVDYAGSSATGRVGAKLLRDGASIFEGDAANLRDPATTAAIAANSNVQTSASKTFLDSPGLDVAITYKVQVMGEGAALAYVNRSPSDTDVAGVFRTVSSITVMEIAG